MATTAPPAKDIQAATLYLYLLSFCPPEKVHEFNQSSHPLRAGLALNAGQTLPEYLSTWVPQACRRIVAFHQASREPDENLVAEFIEAARVATTGPGALRYFNSKMNQITGLPERADAENRLRKSKGCQYCLHACRYGYFTLLVEPNYALMKAHFETETKKKKAEKDPVMAAWSFAIGVLQQSLGVDHTYITSSHLGNLAYCMMALGTSKSRYPFPEDQFRSFQVVNQEIIRRWPGTGEGESTGD